MRYGIAYVPEDRQSGVACAEHLIGFNPPLALLSGAPVRPGLPGRPSGLVVDFIDWLRIRHRAASDQLPGALSGGNQQKVVIAKWLATDPSVPILDDPTKGTTSARRPRCTSSSPGMAERGLTIVPISNEFEELLAVRSRDHVLPRRAGGFWSSTPGSFDAERCRRR
ncbi:ATP-binding cassette domain-containing protein [Pseudonocardia sp. MCCB 268]|nr:ATP-binding cassette domain-containing protein [Pseudonocardia cytotoxica]